MIGGYQCLRDAITTQYSEASILLELMLMATPSESTRNSEGPANELDVGEGSVRRKDWFELSVLKRSMSMHAAAFAAH